MFSATLPSSRRNIRPMMAAFILHLAALACMIAISWFLPKHVFVSTHNTLVSTLTFVPVVEQPAAAEGSVAVHSPNSQTVIVAVTPAKVNKISKASSVAVDAPVGPPPTFVLGSGSSGTEGVFLGISGRGVVLCESGNCQSRQRSNLSDGMLLKKVMPEYPLVVRRAGIQGPVVVHAVISPTGVVRSVSIVSGPPQLRRVTADAVRQWRYRPYILNGRAIEIETTITVNFVLGYPPQTDAAPPAVLAAM